MCFGFILFILISLSALEKASIIQTKQNLETFAYALESIIQNKTNLLLNLFRNAVGDRRQFFVKSAALRSKALL